MAASRKLHVVGWGGFCLSSVSSLAIHIPEGHSQVLPLELSPPVSKALEALWVQK